MPKPPDGGLVSSPLQQISSVIATRDFLLRLSTPSAMPRVNREIRGEARNLLRHYPPAERLRPILEEGLKRPPAA
ncbi:MAG: BPSL0761 family protein [Steroidobacteraceae bacterium]